MLKFNTKNFNKNLDGSKRQTNKHTQEAASLCAHKAFTLAEVLITIGIIGIVSMLVIPTLVSEYQKIIYAARLKTAYTEIQQGFKLIMANQNATHLNQTSLYSEGVTPTSPNGQKLQYDTINKYFKVNKSCLTPDYSCIVDGYKGLDGRTLSGDAIGYLFSSNRPSFFLLDGIAFQLEAGPCEPSPDDPFSQGSLEVNGVCGTVHIDTNGRDKPNKWGRDAFRFLLSGDGVLYPTSGKVYAQLFGDYSYWNNDAPTACGTRGDSSITGVHGYGCAARIMEEGWKMNY